MCFMFSVLSYGLAFQGFECKFYSFNLPLQTKKAGTAGFMSEPVLINV